MNILHDYCDFLHTLKRSPKTIDAYRYAASDYCAFMGFNWGSVMSSKPEDVVRYVEMLSARGLAAITINGRLSALESFFDFAKIKCFVSLSPVIKQRLSVASHVPTFIDSSIMDRALCAMCPATYKQWRGYIAVCICYYSGVRASEAVTLKWADVDFKEGTLHVRDGKGSKDRVIFCPDLIPQLYAFSIMFPYYPNEPILSVDFPLRKRAQGAALSTKELRAAIYAMLFPFLPPEVIHPHALRHSCATRWAEQGMTAEQIAKNLGHSSIDTSLIYLHLQKRLKK